MFTTTEDLTSKLIIEASGLGITLSKSDASSLLSYLNLVLDKNTQINLTRITTIESGIRLHLIDSLLFRKYLIGRSFCDIGTGAGFPGIPLLLTTKNTAILLDSVGKKICAVNEFLAELKLSDRASGVHDRAESFALQHKFEFDSVVARAVAPLNVLIEYASPLLHKGGHFIASKGRITPEEEQDAIVAAKLCGFSLISRDTYSLPADSGMRTFFVYEKDKSSSIKLPRSVGKAKHSPLQ